jgi:hypothetical protein
MLQGYRPSREALAVRLSHHHRNGFLVRVKCRCSVRHYYPGDLIKLLGDIPVLHVELHMRKCSECGQRDNLKVSFVIPSAAERASLRVLKLAGIKTKFIPIWQEERWLDPVTGKLGSN